MVRRSKQEDTGLMVGLRRIQIMIMIMAKGNPMSTIGIDPKVAVRQRIGTVVLEDPYPKKGKSKMKEIIKNYHDWYLTNISTSLEEDFVELTFVSAGQQSIIRFREVRKCLINNFTIGNIVLDIESYSGKQSIDSLLQDTAFRNLFDLPDEDLHYQKVLDEIKQEHLTYIEIHPSYGCSVQILCADTQELP